MKKIAAILLGLLLPAIALAQIVPAQNQVTVQPYGGLVYSTSTTATAKLYQLIGNTFGQLTYWNGTKWDLIATSSLGIISSDENWNMRFGALTPTTTVGILVSASSTIGNGAQAGGLTVNGGATTTGIAYFGDKVGIGTTSPFAKLSITNGTPSLPGAVVQAAGSQSANIQEWQTSAGAVKAKITSAGEFSNAITTGSEAFGAGISSGSGLNQVLIGNGVSTVGSTAPGNIAIGNSVVINNDTGGSGSIVIGYGAGFAGANGVVIGQLTNGGNNNGVLSIGSMSTLSNGASLSLGNVNTLSDFQARAIGQLNVSAFKSTTLIGAGLTALRRNEVVLGDSAQSGTGSWTDGQRVRIASEISDGTATSSGLFDTTWLTSTAGSQISRVALSAYNVGTPQEGLRIDGGSLNPTVILAANGGNVGIGTTSPYARLSVVGPVVAEYFTATTTQLNTLPTLLSSNATSTNLGVDLINDISTTGGLAIDVANRSAYDSVGALSLGWETRALYDENGVQVVDWNNSALLDASIVTSLNWRDRTLHDSDENPFVYWGNGNLGIGTTSPYAKLSVVGPVVASYFHATTTLATSTFDGRITANNLLQATGGTNNDVCINASNEFVEETTGVCVVSSQRFKHDIESIDFSALKIVTKLRPVSYSPNDNAPFDFQDTQYGFIAEEVAEADPHLAKYGDDGKPRTLDDWAILSLAVKSIQELYMKFTGLDDRMEKLEKENDELRSRIEALEKSR